MSGGRRKIKTATDDPLQSLFTGAGVGADSVSAVDDLLRAAEDDLLLKLRVDSHSTSRRVASPSSSSLDPDLLHRLEALKSAPPPSRPTPSSSAASVSAAGGDEWGRILGDELAARFAALKRSPASGHEVVRSPDLIEVNDKKFEEWNREDEEDEGEGEDGVSKKEVDKLMQWAMDAARLGLAAPESNVGDGDDDESDIKSSDDEEDEAEDEKELTKSGTGKAKPRKWFLF